MIDGDKVGKEWQSHAKSKLEKLGFNVKELDTIANDKRIDFLVRSFLNKESFLCEVKSVNSGGYDRDAVLFISTTDINFLKQISSNSKTEAREFNYNPEHVDKKVIANLDDAKIKLRKAKLDDLQIDKNKIPYIVCMCFDFVFFVEQIDFPEIIKNYPTISAILVLDSKQQEADFKVFTNDSANISFNPSILK